MLNQLPYALIIAQRTTEAEAHSALPNAPVVDDGRGLPRRERTYRTRVALASRLARFADTVAPKGWAPPQTFASR